MATKKTKPDSKIIDMSWHGTNAKCGECGAVGHIYQHGFNASDCWACGVTNLSRADIDHGILAFKSKIRTPPD